MISNKLKTDKVSLSKSKNEKRNFLETESLIVAEIKGLSKSYSKKAELAVDNVSFTLKRGEIVGLLGSNGAGKSTTLKCLTGMLAPTEGEIFILGKSIKNDPVSAKQQFSFVTDNHTVFVKMTGKQYLSFMADIYGVCNENRQIMFEKLESVFHIGDKMNSLIASYSHGMKQKICIMGSLMHSPRLWILDEPMVGLDPLTMRAVQDFMVEYASEGNTILFSSHNLDIVERICNRALIINHGKLLLDLDLNAEKEKNNDFSLEQQYNKFVDPQEG